jgi:hypothetical protein
MRERELHVVNAADIIYEAGDGWTAIEPVAEARGGNGVHVLRAITGL